MTYPTQAQIEACPHELWERESSVVTEGYCPICMAEHIAKLTAAAEVDSFARHSVDFQEGIVEGRAEMKERCAQVAENYQLDDIDRDSANSVIAAAIRALKDDRSNA